MNNNLHIHNRPSKIKKVAWYLRTTLATGDGTQMHFFISTRKNELIKTWNSIRHHCTDYGSLDWCHIVNGKVEKNEITKHTALTAFFSDPQELLTW